MENKRILLSSPRMMGKEQEYVNEAFATNWIAPLGPFVNRLEDEFKSYMNLPGACALSSGTAALHLAIKLAGVTQGDYVFCSSLTFAASANPIVYEKAIPVFIDITKCEKLQSNYNYTIEKPVFAIMINAENTELSVKFLDYLMEKSQSQ